MSKVHGKGTYLKVGATVVSGQMNTVDYSGSVGVADVTSFGDGAEVSIPGLEGGTITVSGFYDTATAATLLGLAALPQTTSTYEYGPGGNVTGSIKIAGSCVVTSMQVTGSTTNAVAMSISMQKSGAVTVSTY